MNVRLGRRSLEGERVLQTAPPMRLRVSDEWYRRPLLVTGRALTEDTLNATVRHHLRHLQLFGRHLSPGTVQGLEVSSYLKSGGGGVRETWLQITAGIGLTHSGDDVVLPATTHVYLENVPRPDSDDPPRGVGFLVLEPLEVIDEIRGDSESQCQWDAERDPFDDEQIIDACRLLFLPWPAALGPLPGAEGDLLRNRLAYSVFDFESNAYAGRRPAAKEFQPYTPMPWEAAGLPIALVQITPEGGIAFIDRYSVVRQGGAPPSAKALAAFKGTPFLWEARIQQFINQVYDLKRLTDGSPAARDHFEVLPPVGMLPHAWIDLENRTSDFFPSQFRVDAVPIPEEQLEVAMNASAGLAPFDLNRPERIKLLVPVPQSVFEPRLLIRETPDPIFLTTLRKLVTQIRLGCANRDHLRSMAARVVGALDVHQVPVFGDDPDGIPDEGKFPSAVNPDPQIIAYHQRATECIQALHEWIVANTKVAPEDIEALDPAKVGTDAFPGLDPFIAELADHIARAEKCLATGFLRAETDMYRLRQLLLGNVKASRLATSPAMGAIVAGRTATPTVADVEAYFQGAAAPQAGADEGVLSMLSKSAPPDRIAPREMAGKSESEKLRFALDIVRKQETDTSLQTLELLKAAGTIASVLAKRVGDSRMAVSMLAQPDKVRIDDDRVRIDSDDILFVKAYRPPAAQPWKIGLTRDKKIIDRIYESPAMEVKSNTVLTKSSVFDCLARLPLHIDETVTVAPSGTAVLDRGVYESILKNWPADDPRTRVLEARSRKSTDFAALAVTALTDDEKKGLNDAQVADLEAVFFNHRTANRRGLRNPKLSRSIREGLFDPDPTDGDEANYFSVGVATLEHGLEAIRAVDRLLEDYRRALKQCRQVLGDLQRNRDRWSDALAETETHIRENRRDALVTRSLFEEEKARLNTVNAYRRAVLERYVTCVAYVRPRLVEARREAPVATLRGVYVNPVPACLQEDFDAADELREMLDVFREIPLRWLPNAGVLLHRLDRPSTLATVVQQAVERAGRLASARATSLAADQGGYQPNRYGAAALRIIQGHGNTKQTAWADKRRIDLSGLSALSWIDLTRRALAAMSLADLIESGRGRSALARKAAALMEDMEDVAVCLYHRTRELLPSIRLQWASRISEFDDPIDLSQMDRLPGWSEVDVFVRRDLQHFADWLFAQAAPDIPPARDLVNDLVRVCLLMASHAPVSAIIGGHVAEAARGKTGDVVDVAADRGLVRIGMLATVFGKDKVQAQGVVTDIVGGAARITITHAGEGEATFAIDSGAQVKFHQSNAVKRYFS